MTKNPTFDFGVNWQNYSETTLDTERFEAARASLARLAGEGALRDRTFLDVGCGTGLFTLAAMKSGARRSVGIDVNPLCVEVARRNAARFSQTDLAASEENRPAFRVVSALDTSAMDALGTFETVYAWGSLHHTGRMQEAIENTARCVAPGGTFVLAIYNRHWSSAAWTVIKRFYNLSPEWLKPVWNAGFGAVIFCAKWIVTRRNPLKMERGMNFYHDVVDWIGGYPYEYASAADMTRRVEAMGFKLRRLVPAGVPTGNNEFVFEKCL